MGTVCSTDDASGADPPLGLAANNPYASGRGGGGGALRLQYVTVIMFVDKRNGLHSFLAEYLCRRLLQTQSGYACSESALSGAAFTNSRNASAPLVLVGSRGLEIDDSSAGDNAAGEGNGVSREDSDVEPDAYGARILTEKYAIPEFALAGFKREKLSCERDPDVMAARAGKQVVRLTDGEMTQIKSAATLLGVDPERAQFRGRFLVYTFSDEDQVEIERAFPDMTSNFSSCTLRKLIAGQDVPFPKAGDEVQYERLARRFLYGPIGDMLSNRVED